MRINAFAIGISSDYIISGRNCNKPGFNSLNMISRASGIDNIIQREEYQSNLEGLKEQARIRCDAPYIKLEKNMDGTITTTVQEDRGDDINWASLNLELVNHGSSVTGFIDHIGYDLDYFASEYMQYKTRIIDTLTGDEQKESLQKLDSLFYSRVESIADQFSEKLGGFMNVNSDSSEEERIKNSVMDIFEQRIGQYWDFVQQNDNYSGLKGTEESWLLNDGIFMGEQLRYSFVSKNPEMNLTSEAGYSIDDLTAVAAFVRETCNIRYTSGMSEEEFAVNLGIAAMKYELIGYKYDISEDIEAKMDMAFNQFVNNHINKANEYIEKMLKDPLARNKTFYIPLSGERIWNTVRNMQDNLNSGNINEAFKKDMKTLWEMYKVKTQKDIPAYDSDIYAWNYFNRSEESRELLGISRDITIGKRASAPYLEQLSISEKNKVYFDIMENNLAGEWNSFVKRLDINNQDLYLLNQSFSAVDIYR